MPGAKYLKQLQNLVDRNLQIMIILVDRNLQISAILSKRRGIVPYIIF